MDIYERIKQDHDEARKLMKDIKETANDARKTRQELFTYFKKDMWSHHKLEEAVFYATLEAHRETRGEALEAVNEHHVANGLLEELDSVPVDNAAWAKKFEVLCEVIEHHMEEEEEEIFEEARSVYSDEEAKKLAGIFDERKKTLLETFEPVCL